MATIPNASNLRRVVPQARSRIHRDDSKEIVAEGVSGLLVEVGKAIDSVHDARFESAFVRHQATIAEIVAAHSAPDFEEPEVTAPDGTPFFDLKMYATPEGFLETEKVRRTLTRGESFDREMDKAQKLLTGSVYVKPRHRQTVDTFLVHARSRGRIAVNAAESAKRADKSRAELVAAEHSSAKAVAASPESLEEVGSSMSAAYQSNADAGVISQEEAVTRRQAWISRAARLVIAGRDPKERLELLANPNSSAKYLSPEDRMRMQVEAEADAASELEQREAEAISGLWRDDARAGAAALAALDESDLSPERQDGIRRKVRESVELLRGERQAEYADAMARLETRIATGASYAEIEPAIETLNRRGALTPAQYSSLRERAVVSAQRSAAETATRQEVAAAMQAGIPLDPGNGKHRDFLADAFAVDSRGLDAGSDQWQGLALAYASRARMLPGPAGSWLRAAARAPDAALAGSAAVFWGSLQEQAPEAIGLVDTDTRAFLSQMGGMLQAGAEPQKAFETARANVFETRRDVVEAREGAYTKHAKDTDGALQAYIDEDFDTAFRAEPGASTTLRADFDAQSRAYFTKTGDITLARELAWSDVRRIYGVTEVNGQPVVSAFPVESFGVTPQEARGELSAFLKGTGIRAEDVWIVPDGLTLRSVTDALTGQAVQPSYKLVTTDGDLVLGADGVPVRYTLPGGEELAARIEAAREKASSDAAAAISEAKARRARLEEAKRRSLEFGRGMRSE